MYAIFFFVFFSKKIPIFHEFYYYHYCRLNFAFYDCDSLPSSIENHQITANQRSIKVFDWLNSILIIGNAIVWVTRLVWNIFLKIGKYPEIPTNGVTFCCWLTFLEGLEVKISWRNFLEKSHFPLVCVFSPKEMRRKRLFLHWEGIAFEFSCLLHSWRTENVPRYVSLYWKTTWKRRILKENQWI